MGISSVIAFREQDLTVPLARLVERFPSLCPGYEDAPERPLADRCERWRRTDGICAIPTWHRYRTPGDGRDPWIIVQAIAVVRAFLEDWAPVWYVGDWMDDAVITAQVRWDEPEAGELIRGWHPEHDDMH